MLSATQTFLCEAVNDLFALSGIVHMRVTERYCEYGYVQSVSCLGLKTR